MEYESHFQILHFNHIKIFPLKKTQKTFFGLVYYSKIVLEITVWPLLIK